MNLLSSLQKSLTNVEIWAKKELKAIDTAAAPVVAAVEGAVKSISLKDPLTVVLTIPQTVEVIGGDTVQLQLELKTMEFSATLFSTAGTAVKSFSTNLLQDLGSTGLTAEKALAAIKPVLAVLLPGLEAAVPSPALESILAEAVELIALLPIA